MTGEMTSALLIAIMAYQDLRDKSPDAKPEGVGAEWWESYTAARDAATPDAPRGERGVTATGLPEEGGAGGTEGAQPQPQSQVDGDEEVVIKIYGYIERWTVSDFDYYLSRAGTRPVRVRIASPGGDAGAGLQIYTMIRKRGGVTTEADGPIASAASVIFLAGQERLIPKEAASVMVHRSWLFTCQAGNVGAWKSLIQKIENVLTVIDDGMAAVLAARMGGTKAKAMEYLDAETYFTPDQCMDNGIATGYCEYADEGETDPQDGESTSDPPMDDDERMERQGGASAETKPKAEKGAKAGGDHQKERDAEQQEQQEQSEEASSAADAGEGAPASDKAQGAEDGEDGEDGDEVEEDESEASGADEADGAAAAESPTVQSEQEERECHIYPRHLREEI